MSKVAAICFVLLFTLATGVWVSARASGHSMTFLAASTPAPCLALHTSWSATLYNLAGPTDRTWVIRVGVGLASNNSADTVQSFRFEFNLIDNANSAEVGRFADGGWYHIQTNVYTHYGTITAHVGGT